MKRFFSVLLILLGLSFASQSLSAQVCSIKGSNGDTVQVFGSSMDRGTLTVTLGSDSQYAATVDVTVSVTYNDGYRSETRTYSTKCIAQPGQTTPVTLSVPEKISVNGRDYPLADYKITLSGNKCI